MTSSCSTGGVPADCFRVAGFAVLSACVAIAVCGCNKLGAEKAAAKGSKKGAQPPASVRVAAVERRKVVPRVTVVGTVIPRWTSVAASGAAGIVKTFNIEEGQFVTNGDVLSELRMVTTDLAIAEAKSLLRERQQQLAELEAGSRKEEIEEARARMLAAQALMNSTAAKLTRTKALIEKNAANQDELDDAVQRAEAGRQAFAAAEAKSRLVQAGPRQEQIEQARARFQAQREHVAFLDAEKAKRITRIPAEPPITGYITKTHTFVGMWLSKGDPIATVTYLDEVDVVANVDQRDLKHIQLGHQADVRLTSGYEMTRLVTADGKVQQGIVSAETEDEVEITDSAGRVSRIRKDQIDQRQITAWQGTIAFIVPRSEWQTGSRGFPVKVRVKNCFVDLGGKRRPVIKEGMMAEVVFRGTPVDALLVPKDSLVRTSSGPILYVFQPDNEKPETGTVVQVPVVTGINDVSPAGVSQIEVKGEGIAAGMQIVTEGAERMRPFQTVRVEKQSRQQNPKSEIRNPKQIPNPNNE